MRVAFGSLWRPLALGLVMVLGTSPLAALAQPVPPSLMGESLNGSSFDPDQSLCDTDNQSTFNYTEMGIATGPYPGTYTETGTFTIAPQPVPGTNVQLLAFHSEFHIDSPVGQVDGTKDLVVVSNTSACFTLLDEPVNPSLCGGVEPCRGTVELVGFSAQVTYEATIVTAIGTFTDGGTAFVTHHRINSRVGPRSGREAGSSENFTTSDGVVPLDAAAVVLSPPTAVNTVGGTHTVTATALNLTGGPVAGTTILFTVEGSVSAQGSCTTDAQGQCSFTYQGPELPGADLITGCADNNDNDVADPGEPCGEATKIWVLPATTPGQVTGGGWLVNPDGRQVSFGFNAQSDGRAVKGNCNVIDHAMKTHIKCLSVDVLVVAGTHATFFGQASVDGTRTNYRIDVDDLGEAGTLDTFKIQTDSGHIAGGTLAGGNIQIHR